MGAQKLLFLCSLLLIFHLCFTSRNERSPKNFGSCKKNNKKGYTFKVADVKKENPSEIFRKSSFNQNVYDIVSYWKKVHPKQQLYFDSGLANHQTFVSANRHMHGLLATVLTAYKYHMPLILTPDDLWLLVALSVGQFLGDDPQVAEKYRHSFVEHKGKKELTVPVSPQVFSGDPEARANAWAAAFEDMCKLIKNETATDLADLMTEPFSTSGPVEKTVMHATLKETMKNYFVYSYLPICGIPTITLEGPASDYKSIIDRVDRLISLFPSFKVLVFGSRPFSFVQNLFNSNVQGKISEMVECNGLFFFYNKIESGGCNGPDIAQYFTGWLSDFMAFTSESHKMPGTANNRPTPNKGRKSKFLDFNKPAVTMTDFKLLGGDDKLMKLAAGFVGVALDEKKKALRPAIGWATLKTTQDA